MGIVKIGITGQAGFVGKHLFNTLGLYPDQFERIFFERNYFDQPEKLESFVKQCDVIVHLAAVNRHNDPEFIYKSNRDLAFKLVDALINTGSKAHVIFSSSTQEERDNPYGQSKREAREAIANWAKKCGGYFTGLVIPNVFGPFGHPYYNSVVATFCHQLTHGEQPKIDVDGQLRLIYVGELVEVILDTIKNKRRQDLLAVTYEIKVTEILALLEGYKVQYLHQGIIPFLQNRFEVNLFNTFRCYMDIRNHYPVKYTQHTDQRGAFVEVIRLNVGGQVSFSTTVSGITRGNHFHTRKIERFSVIKGNALIQLRQIGTGDCIDFYLNGSEPAYVDMPVWYTHNIKNTGNEDLYTIFWINEFYDANDPDTFFETV
jgi:UDP-2-acetamido-2,6-beta-L-arabino-hexul-4-ose reductase